ncbi:MAG: type I-C CRISPR-associated endonuclease Cas1c [Oscillospiraceae bacterium]|nr:type I-C CRISPR-associated endonuclease Cas1c [Oscillospiraceae bacterium]
MKKLLNTLYVMSEDAYLTLDGENVVVKRGDTVTARYPLHTLESIMSFSYAGASPSLMGACAEREVNLAFFTPKGKFLARTTGITHGNVLLRQTQYRIADSPEKSVEIAKCFILGKVCNCRNSIERTRRDHGMRVDDNILRIASDQLKSYIPLISSAADTDSLRGFEGVAANAYFDAFDEMILGDKELFRFTVRSRRPPLDPINALLSFAYSILTNDCASALEAVGLDSYVGFMHTARPGRKSLALDLMEELRPCIADRFVLTLINTRQLHKKDFDFLDSGAVIMSDDARKTFLRAWQDHKREEITHPYLGEKIPWGLVPAVQAQLLSRYLRGDLDAYPPFLWK